VNTDVLQHRIIHELSWVEHALTSRSTHYKVISETIFQENLSTGAEQPKLNITKTRNNTKNNHASQLGLGASFSQPARKQIQTILRLPGTARGSNIHEIKNTMLIQCTDKHGSQDAMTSYDNNQDRILFAQTTHIFTFINTLNK